MKVRLPDTRFGNVMFNGPFGGVNHACINDRLLKGIIRSVGDGVKRAAKQDIYPIVVNNYHVAGVSRRHVQNIIICPKKIKFGDHI